MKIIKLKLNPGFTLVEVMISIGLFTVVMVIGIGAILGVNSTHRKTQSMRSVVDNLSFIMEDMARSMRLGDYLVCDEDQLTPIGALEVGNPQNRENGENCKSISFEPYWNYSPNDDENQIIYFINESNGIGTIFKKTETMGWSEPMIAITPAEIDIDTDKSGFWVTGALKETESIPTQPKVTIVLVGTVRLGNAVTEFNLETTVSQRLLDITP